MLDDEDTRGLRSTFRLYSRISANVDRHWFTPDFSRPDRRVILEIGMSPGSANRDIARALGMDDGQLSHRLTALSKRGFLSSEPSPDHQRQKLRTLTESGLAVFAQLLDQLDQVLQAEFNAAPAYVRDAILRASGISEADPLGSREHSLQLRILSVTDASWMYDKLLARNPPSGLYASFVADKLSKFFKNPGKISDWGWAIGRFDMPLALCMLTLKPDAMSASVMVEILDKKATRIGLEKQLLERAVKQANTLQLNHVTGWAAIRDCGPRDFWRVLGFEIDKKRTRPSFDPHSAGFREATYRVPRPRGRPPTAE